MSERTAAVSGRRMELEPTNGTGCTLSRVRELGLGGMMKRMGGLWVDL